MGEARRRKNKGDITPKGDEYKKDQNWREVCYYVEKPLLGKKWLRDNIKKFKNAKHFEKFVLENRRDGDKKWREKDA